MKSGGRKIADGDGVISVITPCYNAETFRGEVIESALGQTYLNVGVIVVADRSRDAHFQECARTQRSRFSGLMHSPLVEGGCAVLSYEELVADPEVGVGNIFRDLGSTKLLFGVIWGSKVPMDWRGQI